MAKRRRRSRRKAFSINEEQLHSIARGFLRIEQSGMTGKEVLLRKMLGDQEMFNSSQTPYEGLGHRLRGLFGAYVSEDVTSNEDIKLLMDQEAESRTPYTGISILDGGFTDDEDDYIDEVLNSDGDASFPEIDEEEE